MPEFWWEPESVLWIMYRKGKPIPLSAPSKEEAEKFARERFGAGRLVPDPDANLFPGINPEEESHIS